MEGRMEGPTLRGGLEWGDVAFSAYETAIPIRLFFRITVLFVT